MHRACGVRSRFWSGCAALSAAQMVNSVQRRTITTIAQFLTKTEQVHVTTAMAQLRSWDGVGPYHAYDTLRSLRAVLGLKLRCEQQAAKNMSMKVAMLAGILPLAEVVRIVRQAHGAQRQKVHLGDAALTLCETGKALNKFGILRPQKQYTKGELEAVLSCAETAQLLNALETCDPLTETELVAKRSKWHAEQRQLDACMPKTEELWDKEHHYAVGSEYLTSLYTSALRRRGWRKRWQT